MTYTINADCDLITLDSTYLTPDNQSVEVYWARNCDEVGETPLDFNVNETDLEIVPVDLGDTTTFSDAVYYFKILITQEDGSTVEESICKFVNCESSCLMLPVYKLTDSDSLLKILAFEALLASANCTSCSCADLCALYTATGLTTIENDNCNCDG